MTEIRYAIIGAGMMGQEHIRNIALLENTSVSVICDPDQAMRDESLALAEQLGSKHITAVSSAAEIDLAALADALVIVSPNHTHHSLLKELLPLEIPILVEKPLCTTIEDTEEIVSAMKHRKAPVWVAMEYRYMPPTSRLIKEIQSNRIGNLQMLSIQEHRYPFLPKIGDWNRFSKNTGGTLVEKCCHYFDLMCLITKANPTRIFASGGCDVNHLDERYDGRTPDIIDNALAIVDFDNGMRCSMDLCMFAEGSDPQEIITAVGDNGKLVVRLPGPDRFWPDTPPRHADLAFMPREASPATIETIEVDEKLLAAGDHHGGTFYQHFKFANAIRTGAPVEVSVSDGAIAVAIGLAAEQSIKTGEAVKIHTRNLKASQATV